MTADINSILATAGVFAATVGVCSFYTNLITYYGTKQKIIRLAREEGNTAVDKFIEREESIYKSPIRKLIGGIGTSLVARKYREGRVSPCFFPFFYLKRIELTLYLNQYAS